MYPKQKSSSWGCSWSVQVFSDDYPFLLKLLCCSAMDRTPCSTIDIIYHSFQFFHVALGSFFYCTYQVYFVEPIGVVKEKIPKCMEEKRKYTNRQTTSCNYLL